MGRLPFGAAQGQDDGLTKLTMVTVPGRSDVDSFD